MYCHNTITWVITVQWCHLISIGISLQNVTLYGPYFRRHSPKTNFTGRARFVKWIKKDTPVNLLPHLSSVSVLTRWDKVMHICIGNLIIIGSDNGLSPGQRQAIIWTNAGLLLIGPFRTNFSEILIEIYTVSFKKMHLKMLSGKWRPFCLSLNVLTSQ